MEEYLLVITTFDSLEEAKKMVDLLLEKRLVSCCQVSPITSKYYWKGKIEETDEIQVKMKTKKSLWVDLRDFILEHHSYETPEIVAYPIILGNDDYLKWIHDETK